MPSNETEARAPLSGRILSVDSLRAFVMFAMIFVNDLAGAPERIVPAWMRHFHGVSGMTFVDLVFPGFLFIVGLSLPLALARRLKKQSIPQVLLHIALRTGALLLIGIMMVNDEAPDARELGWSPALWATLFYLAAILAFSTFEPDGTKEASRPKGWRFVRIAGFLLLAFLAVSFRGAKGQRIVTFSPFSIHTEWYGILGLIGWAYLVGSLIFLAFRANRTALLGCMTLLLCLYPADRNGAFKGFWLASYVGIGGTLGSQASITVAGMLLGTILQSADLSTLSSRLRFTLLFILGCAAAALLVHGLYGIYKNSATPSWCLWSCAITASLWMLFHLGCDRPQPPPIARWLAFTGSNVLLAYLLSEMLPSLLELIGLGTSYDRIGQINLAAAIARSLSCAGGLMAVATALNRRGFRLRI